MRRMLYFIFTYKKIKSSQKESKKLHIGIFCVKYKTTLSGIVISFPELFHIVIEFHK